MKDFSKSSPEESDIEQAAAEWTLRISRGLSPSEQDAYTDWLAMDPRHRRTLAEFQWGWEEFDRLAGIQTTRHAEVDPDLLKPKSASRKALGISRRWLPWLALAPLAAAAAVAFLLLRVEPQGGASETAAARLSNLPPRIQSLVLEDGSQVQLNLGAAIETAFTKGIRRVRLLSGEASFQVTHDPSRPFIVEGAGVHFQAVGTAFNVRLASSSVDLIVTEGKVRIGSDAADGSAAPLLSFGQRGLVNLDAAGGKPAIIISTLQPPQIEQELAWQPRLLDFDATPLPKIVEAFNRSNRVKLVVADPTLENLVLSSSFWSDNLEGFVRLMESSFALQAEWQGSDKIVLRRARLSPSASER